MWPQINFAGMMFERTWLDPDMTAREMVDSDQALRHDIRQVCLRSESLRGWDEGNMQCEDHDSNSISVEVNLNSLSVPVLQTSEEF